MQIQLNWNGSLILHNVYLSIGSNKGDRLKNIKKTILLMDNHSDIKIIDKSNIYETKPLYNLKQKYFLNMVLLVETNINPNELLQETQSIEKKIGRVYLKKNNNQPRKIDIDILTYSNKNIFTNNLVVPHPKIKERAFVLKPWSDIDPNYKLSNMEQTISELLSNISLNSDIIKYHAKS